MYKRKKQQLKNTTNVTEIDKYFIYVYIFFK